MICWLWLLVVYSVVCCWLLSGFGISVVSVLDWVVGFGFLVWFVVGFVWVVCSLARYLVCCWLLSLGGLGVLGLVLVLLVCCGLAICLVVCWFPSITFTVDYCGG